MPLSPFWFSFSNLPSPLSLADIRHPEELSLLKPVEEKKKKKITDDEDKIHDATFVPLPTGKLV